MKKILPLPVKKNKFDKSVKDLSVTEYYRQIEEEVLEAFKEAVLSENSKVHGQNEAEELVDIITTCITRLEIIGCDENKRQELYAAVNEKNKKRGYFEE